MVKKQKKELSFIEKILTFKKAGFSHSGASNRIEKKSSDNLIPLPERIKKVLEISYKSKHNALDMLYFIMYDIENNKVRTAIGKYLLKSGCLRVQKSIFFAESKRDKFIKIHSDLKAIQEMYDNSDSIIIVPVSTDQLKSMKVIGYNIDFEIIIENKNTLFF